MLQIWGTCGKGLGLGQDFWWVCGSYTQIRVIFLMFLGRLIPNALITSSQSFGILCSTIKASFFRQATVIKCHQEPQLDGEIEPTLKPLWWGEGGIINKVCISSLLCQFILLKVVLGSVGAEKNYLSLSLAKMIFAQVCCFIGH